MGAMPRWLLRSLCLAVPCLAWAAVLPSAAQQPDPVPEVYLFKNPKPAPPLTVTTVNGQQLNLASLRGKVVLLNFWATWCTFCRQEMPELEQLQRQYAGKLQVVGLSVDEMPASPTARAAAVRAVAAAAAHLGANYPIAVASQAVQNEFGGLESIPVTWVIDPNGEVEQKNRGLNPYPVFETEVRALLGLPVTIKVARIDQLSPDGKVSTVDIPGIAALLKQLSPAQRAMVLAKLNDQACTCGCEWSLATCRVKDPSCGYSLPEAEQLIRSLTGKSK